MPWWWVTVVAVGLTLLTRHLSFRGRERRLDEHAKNLRAERLRLWEWERALMRKSDESGYPHRIQ